MVLENQSERLGIQTVSLFAVYSLLGFFKPNYEMHKMHMFTMSSKTWNDISNIIYIFQVEVRSNLRRIVLKSVLKNVKCVNFKINNRHNTILVIYIL